MPYQACDLQGLLHAEAIPHSIERGIADFVIAQEFLHVAHQHRLIASETVRARAACDGLDGVFGETGLPRQAGMGVKLVLAFNLPRGGEDDGLAQSFGQLQVVAHVGTRVSHPRCEVRAMQEDAIRPPDTATAVGNAS